MTDWMARYLAGSEIEVWSELAKLRGDALSDANTSQEAWAVCVETMRRVRENCDRIVDRLERGGFLFDDPPMLEYPPGTYLSGHRFSPAPNVADTNSQIETKAGACPMSLTAFWREVGTIALVGQWPLLTVTNDMADPLWVYGPDATLTDINDFAEEDDWEPTAVVAPDNLHKGNISGGAPYRVAIGQRSVDSEILDSTTTLHHHSMRPRPP